LGASSRLQIDDTPQIIIENLRGDAQSDLCFDQSEPFRARGALHRPGAAPQRIRIGDD
jgi:hypothetical protein